MQESPASIPQWMQPALIALASILSGIGIDRLYNSWLNRKKPSADIHLTEANATEVTVRAYSTAGDAIGRMIDKLTEAQSTIDQLRQERDAWQDEYDKAFTERDDLLRRNGMMQDEVNSYENQIKTMRATLEKNNLNFDNTQNAKPGEYALPPKKRELDDICG